MKTVLFCIPLKQGSLSQYEAFAKQSVEKPKEYAEMLKRYDIYSAKIWHKNIDSHDYIFVYHDVGPQFEEKMKEWDTSDHPFDTWFRENMMAVYNINNAGEMEQPRQLVNFNADTE